jgi:hypothetical protein
MATSAVLVVIGLVYAAAVELSRMVTSAVRPVVVIGLVYDAAVELPRTAPSAVRPVVISGFIRDAVAECPHTHSHRRSNRFLGRRGMAADARLGSAGVEA